MRLLRSIICMLLMLSLVGCAVSRNPNPMIRYGVNTGTALAVPGIAAFCLAGAIGSLADSEKIEEKDRSDDDDLGSMALIGVGAAAAGFAVGAVLGGTVGFFKWMLNGFEDDNVGTGEHLPEEILPPVRPAD